MQWRRRFFQAFQSRTFWRRISRSSNFPFLGVLAEKGSSLLITNLSIPVGFRKILSTKMVEKRHLKKSSKYWYFAQMWLRKFIENQLQPRKEIGMGQFFFFKKGENNKFSIINWINWNTQWTAVSCERYGKRKKTKRVGWKNVMYT